MNCVPRPRTETRFPKAILPAPSVRCHTPSQMGFPGLSNWIITRLRSVTSGICFERNRSIRITERHFRLRGFGQKRVGKTNNSPGNGCLMRCVAGRFLDVSTTTDAEVVGIDISGAIDAAKENLSGRGNVHFVQASIYELPFRPGTFDYCYCIGVLQHTPDPGKSLQSVAEMVAPGGRIAVTIYERRKWYTMLFSKYWLRPITKRMSKESLLKIITGVMPAAFPVTNILFRIPVLGKFFMFIIPVANYVYEKQLSRKQRYDWAILDTFDMLSPQFDSPMNEAEAADAMIQAGIEEISRNSNNGLNLIGKGTAAS